MSSAQQSRGVEVHAARARVVGLHIFSKPDKQVEGGISCDQITPEQKANTAAGRPDKEYVQIFVRFNALEKEIVWSDGKVVERADAVVR